MSGEFVISLDFELLWGVRDHLDRAGYGRNVLGAREAIPRILDLFAKYEIRATWATVGFLFCETKEELLASLPEERPVYNNTRLSNYTYIEEVGENERADPYYFGASLVSAIAQTPGQEVGTHTLSHYYCLEDGPTLSSFEADLVATKRLGDAKGIVLKSIVFPRNQFAPAHLKICGKHGIVCFRGNPKGWAYSAAKEKEQTSARRALRLLDAYSNALGVQTFVAKDVHGVTNIPASRFLRPYAGRLAPLHPLHLSTIMRGMTDAARAGRGYHLWWHPHNFGRDIDESMAGLVRILAHFVRLRDHFGMCSFAMKDFM